MAREARLVGEDQWGRWAALAAALAIVALVMGGLAGFIAGRLTKTRYFPYTVTEIHEVTQLRYPVTVTEQVYWPYKYVEYATTETVYAETTTATVGTATTTEFSVTHVTKTLYYFIITRTVTETVTFAVWSWTETAGTCSWPPSKRTVTVPQGEAP